MGFDTELLVAELAEMGFDSFQEEEDHVSAFIPAELFRQDFLAESSLLRNHPEVNVMVRPLEEKNWNEVWERNYEPVTIGGICHVRAPFHPSLPGMAYEIIIEPKMSFGTAHHATTRLMAAWLMEMDIWGKDLLDMGCGTGILAILANKMRARFVMAIDHDEWAWRNASENIMANDASECQCHLGDASLIEPDQYDMILANINRNVLLQDMAMYAAGLRLNGKLLMSGFYETDADIISTAAANNGLEFEGMKTSNEWAVMLFSKNFL